MEKGLFSLALIAFCLALIVHILSITGVDITAYFPFIWILHLGIFIIWFPTVIRLSKNEEIKAFSQKSFKERIVAGGTMGILFIHRPKYFKHIARLLGLYVMVSFLFFMSTQMGSPELREGAYYLMNRGDIIKEITEAEFHSYKANEVRGFSALWILFYGIGTMLNYPVLMTK